MAYVVLTIKSYVKKYDTGEAVIVSSLPNCYVTYGLSREKALNSSTKYYTATNQTIARVSGDGTMVYLYVFFPDTVGCCGTRVYKYAVSSDGRTETLHSNLTTIAEKIGTEDPNDPGYFYKETPTNPMLFSAYTNYKTDTVKLTVIFYYDERANSIDIQSTPGGTISYTPNADFVVENTLVTLTATPNANCHLSSLKVLQNDENIQLTKVDDLTYTFIMPSNAVIIKAIFETEPNITIHQSDHGLCSTDISGGVPGTLVTISVTLESFAYMLTSLSCVTGETPVKITKIDNYTYSFIMPGNPVDIYPVFELAKINISVQVTFPYQDTAFYTSFPLTIMRAADTILSMGDWWTLYRNGLLHIHCNGDMPIKPTNSNDLPWNDYKTVITRLKIENTVTNIALWAFSGCNNLDDVEIPDSVQEFNQACFANTGLLHGMRFPEGLITIPPYCFYGSDLDIDVLRFPDSLTLIDSYAFGYCKNVKNVRISPNLKLVGDGGSAFVMCTGLISATLISTKNGSFAGDPFACCSSLRWVGIARGATKFNQIFLFADCSNLTDVYFEGTEEEFNDLFRDMTRVENYNSYFYDATKHFNSIGP